MSPPQIMPTPENNDNDDRDTRHDDNGDRDTRQDIHLRRPSNTSHASSSIRSPPPKPPTPTSSQQQPTATTTTTAPPSTETPTFSAGQKRRRYPVSCYECRRRKLKCDREQPCQRCRGSRRECIYANESPAGKVAKLSRYPAEYEDQRHPAYQDSANVYPDRQKSTTPTMPHVFEQRMYDNARYDPLPPQCFAAQEHPHQLPQIQYVSHDLSRVNSIDQHQVPISRLLSAPGDSVPHEYPPLAPGAMDRVNHDGEHKYKNRWFTRGKNAKIRCFGRSHMSSLLTQV